MTDKDLALEKNFQPRLSDPKDYTPVFITPEMVMCPIYCSNLTALEAVFLPMRNCIIRVKKELFHDA